MSSSSSRIPFLASLSLAVWLSGCAETTELSDTEAVSGESGELLSLCTLVEFSDSIGKFSVERIYSRPEPHDRAGTPHAYTYIELSQADFWTPGSRAKPVVRVAGGPLDAARTIPWNVSAAVGEDLVLFMHSHNAEFPNAGHPNLTSDQRVFHWTSVGWDNDVLPAEALADDDEFERRVRGIGENGCQEELEVLPKDPEIPHEEWEPDPIEEQPVAAPADAG